MKTIIQVLGLCMIFIFLSCIQKPEAKFRLIRNNKIVYIYPSKGAIYHSDLSNYELGDTFTLGYSNNSRVWEVCTRPIYQKDTTLNFWYNGIYQRIEYAKAVLLKKY